MMNYSSDQIKKVFNQADNYFVFVDGMEFKKGNHLYLNPYYVNCLFCCELYLKAILMLEGVAIKKEHDLKMLFEEIPDDNVRKKILDTLNDKLESEIDANDFLQKVENDFISIRYMYVEKNKNLEEELNNNFAYCIMLMYVLREYLDLKINGRDTYEEVTGNVSI